MTYSVFTLAVGHGTVQYGSESFFTACQEAIAETFPLLWTHV